MITVAIVGFGYWGPNLLRNFLLSGKCLVKTVCELDTKKHHAIKRFNPSITTTTSLQDILNDQEVDAVAIATPPSTHFDIAEKLLRAGIDVLIEKPMTINSLEARSLVKLAKIKKRIVLVDHTFMYHPAVEEIVKVVKKGTLGKIVSIDSVRTNLGFYQRDVNVIEDLAAHDFSIVDGLIGRLPQKVITVGTKNFDIVQEDQAYIHLWYPGNIKMHVNISWLSPIKTRRMIICGMKKMLVYDDLEVSEKIKIFDTGIKIARDPKEVLRMKVGYRQGNIYSPNIDTTEALQNVISDFLHCIKTRKEPRSNAIVGERVVTIIEAAQKSLRNKGSVVTL